MCSGPSESALQRLVEQLKLEAGAERIEVSQTAAELQQYCTQNACKDALLVRVPAGSDPFPIPGAAILCFTLKTAEKSVEDCLQVQSDECPPSSLKKTLYSRQMTFRYFRPFLRPRSIAKTLQKFNNFLLK